MPTFAGVMLEKPEKGASPQIREHMYRVVLYNNKSDARFRYFGAILNKGIDVSSMGIDVAKVFGISDDEDVVLFLCNPQQKRIYPFKTRMRVIPFRSPCVIFLSWTHVNNAFVIQEDLGRMAFKSGGRGSELLVGKPAVDALKLDQYDFSGSKLTLLPRHEKKIDKPIEWWEYAEESVNYMTAFGIVREREVDPAVKKDVDPEKSISPIVQTLFSAVPQTTKIDDVLLGLKQLGHEFKSAVAARLQPALNFHLQGLSHESYSEKQEIASWVNAQLHDLGLAIKCPKTGKPATLIADVRGGDDEYSRFRLDIRGDDGRHLRTYSSRELPELEIIENEPRVEGLARGRTRQVGRKK